MSDERPKLRLVTDADEDIWDDDGDDPLLNEPAPRAKAPRLPRSGKYFARIPLGWLAIPERGGGYPAWVRLHQYLWFRSREGSRAVRLTGNLATEVGLDRRSKVRALRQLETRGLAAVTRAGNKIPIVMVRPIPDLWRGTAKATRRSRTGNASGHAKATLWSRIGNTAPSS